MNPLATLMICTTTTAPVFDPSYSIPNYSILKDKYMIQSGAKGGILFAGARHALRGGTAPGGGNLTPISDERAGAETLQGGRFIFALSLEAQESLSR